MVDKALYVLVPATVMLFAFFLPAHYVSSEAGLITVAIFAAMMCVLLCRNRVATTVAFELECCSSDSTTFTEWVAFDLKSSMLSEVTSVTGPCLSYFTVPPD
jgi:hypothetical protein